MRVVLFWITLISYITLVPKKLALEEVGDYRPISLTSMGLKFLSKMAANRFQEIILQCIHKNQYGFIKVEQFKIVLGGPLSICISATSPRNLL